MPNYSYNTIAIKGKSKDLLKFFNLGLRNCKQKPETDIDDAFESLKENAYVKVMGDAINSKVKGIHKIDQQKGLYFGTFRHIQDIFHRYDTTNYEKELSAIASKQMAKYGAIGWYKYNCKMFGCKWDCEMEECQLYQDGDIATFVFKCATPWGVPCNWLRWVKDKFPKLSVCILALEESNAYAYYEEIDGEYYDCLPYFDESDSDDEDEMFERYDEFTEEMEKDFKAFVMDEVFV